MIKISRMNYYNLLAIRKTSNIFIFIKIDEILNDEIELSILNSKLIKVKDLDIANFTMLD
jgi:hypothetical protein